MASTRFDDLEVSGKRVLLREDLNVPVDNGRVTDTTRIDAAVPTIQSLTDRGARVIIMSHLGRPGGKVVESLRMAPVAAALSDALGTTVRTASDCVGDAARQAVAAMSNGDVLLLENLRFHPGEEANDPDFARSLAELGDIYIDDAFGTAHRAHASTVGITKFVQKSAAGLLMEKELRYLGKALEHPQTPFVAILGGAKVSDKIGVIQNLMNKVNSLIIGGGMAYTFLKAQGHEVGKSLVEADKLDLATQLLAEAKKKNLRFLLPVDHVVAVKPEPNAVIQHIGQGQPIPPDRMALDIGPKTIELFTEEISRARTIVWNGPMGVFEIPEIGRAHV